MSKPRNKLWGFSVGAGLLGAVLLGVRYAIRKPTKARVPDTISPAIFATRAFTTTLGDLIYHESGQGTPLIFLHGIHVGACSYEWSRVYPSFAADHHVLAPDLIGFGESERPQKHFSAADFVQSLAEFIQGKCSGESPVIVATGLTAALAVQLAAQHPDLVARLILVMPTGMRDGGKNQIPLGINFLSRTPILNRFYYRNHLSARNSIRTWLESVGYADPQLVDEETVEVFSTCAQQYRAERAIFNFLRRQLNVDLEDRFEDLVQPVTLIWSDTVQNPPLESAYRLQKLNSRCQLIILNNLGLLPALEAPDLVHSVLAGELNPDLHVLRATN